MQEHYLTSHEILRFIKEYVREFSLDDHIILKHQVQEVKPLPGDRWFVFVENLETREVIQKEFDSVFVCNGHHWVPNIPKLKGIEHFKGRVMHSYSYRKPEQLEGDC